MCDAVPQMVSDLPEGFSTLGLETDVIYFNCGSEPFGPEWQPDAAEQLCRLLSCAPDSYRHVAIHVLACPLHAEWTQHPVRYAWHRSETHSPWLTRRLDVCRQLWLGPPVHPSAGYCRNISRRTWQPRSRSTTVAVGQYELCMRMKWRRRTESSTEDEKDDKEVVMQGGVEGIAEALARYAADYGLRVSVQDTGRRVVLSRS